MKIKMVSDAYRTVQKSPSSWWLDWQNIELIIRISLRLCKPHKTCMNLQSVDQCRWTIVKQNYNQQMQQFFFLLKRITQQEDSPSGVDWEIEPTRHFVWSDVTITYL